MKSTNLMKKLRLINKLCEVANTTYIKINNFAHSIRNVIFVYLLLGVEPGLGPASPSGSVSSREVSGTSISMTSLLRASASTVLLIWEPCSRGGWGIRGCGMMDTHRLIHLHIDAVICRGSC